MSRPANRPSVRRAAAFALLLASFQISGCGYMVGGPYRQDIQSVHVPIFENLTYRRGIEFQLTEAVHKQIQNETHFRLVKADAADTRLTGRILRINKRVLGETGFDDPRELQLQFVVVVRWEDLRTGKLIGPERTIQLSPEDVSVISTADFAPELGPSMATARQRAVENVARQVVQMMEMPW